MNMSKEVRDRYNRSPKGHARVAKYRMTVKGMLAAMRHSAQQRGVR